MTFWPAPVSSDNLHRLGPWIDGFVGTNGKYSDLYEAVNTGGWKRIVLAQGATLSADLTLSGDNGFIWSPFEGRALKLGGYKITVTGSYWKLQGFGINNPSGIGIEIQGARIKMVDVYIHSAGSYGVYFNTSGYNNVMELCEVVNSSSDGVRIVSGASYVRIENSEICGNGGYGVNDLDDSSILVGNRLDNNTSGAINGTPDIDVGNKKT